MKKTTTHLCALAVLAMLSAATANADTGISATIGTTGTGIHVSRPLTSTLDARVGLNALDYNHSGSTSNVNYDFKLKMLTVDALLDWFPTATGFRVTGGLSYNGNKIDAKGQPNAAGSYTLNGTTYTAAQVGTLSSQIDFRKIAPYLGIGWGHRSTQAKGWSVDADAGVLFQGSPRTNLTSSGCTAPDAVCQQLATDIAAERASLHDKVKDFQYFPVVRLGAMYRF